MKNIKNILKKFIKFIIPNKIKRIILEEKNEESFSKVFNEARTLIHTSPEPNTMLIIEPNNFHGEVLPGLVKYFVDLGYNTELLIRQEIIQENFFCFVEEKYRPKRIHSIKTEKDIVSLYFTDISEYVGVFLNTNTLYSRNISITQCVQHNTKNKVCAILHKDRLILSETDRRMKRENNFFKLIPINGYEMVNTHYFGDIPIKDKNLQTKFITVGQNRDVNALEKALKMSANITHVGYWTDKQITFEYLTKTYPNQFYRTGRISFEQMYQEIINSDFMLLLFNSSIHTDFLNNGVSGLNQLSLGFTKPMVIERPFADFWGWDDNSAIIYDTPEDFSKAVQRAIDMSPEEYNKMKESIKNKSNEICQKSLDNLKKAYSK